MPRNVSIYIGTFRKKMKLVHASGNSDNI